QTSVIKGDEEIAGWLRSSRPSARYFFERNPHYREGGALTILVPLTLANPLARRRPGDDAAVPAPRLMSARRFRAGLERLIRDRTRAATTAWSRAFRPTKPCAPRSRTTSSARRPPARR